MEINPTPDQEDFVRRAIESGRLSREEGAVREARSLREDRERKRVEILEAIDEAEASLARGEGREISADSASKLTDDVTLGSGQRTARARGDTSSFSQI
jgi:Arc/MetJ-type ribon-helix-helix transcriptional regulator